MIISKVETSRGRTTETYSRAGEALLSCGADATERTPLCGDKPGTQESRQVQGREARAGDSLFGRVGELVLPTTVVALLDAGVGPERLDGCDVRRIQGVDRLVVDLSRLFCVLLWGGAMRK